MATGGGSNSNRTFDYNSFDNRSDNFDNSLRNSSNRYESNDRSPSYNSNSSTNRSSTHRQSDLSDSDRQTLELVNEFKTTLQLTKDAGKPLNTHEVEFAVFNAKHNINPDGNSLAKLKRNLPDDLRDIPNDVLITSMAYANDQQDIESICRAQKCPPVVLPNNLLEQLRNLTENLNRNPPAHPCSSVRHIKAKDIQYANRLFYCEVHHMLPSLQSYTFNDAAEAVTAIRDSNYEMKRLDELLPLVKACDRGGANDFMKSLEQQSNQRSEQRAPRNDRSSVSPDRRNHERYNSPNPNQLKPLIKEHVSPAPNRSSQQLDSSVRDGVRRNPTRFDQ